MKNYLVVESLKFSINEKVMLLKITGAFYDLFLMNWSKRLNRRLKD